MDEAKETNNDLFIVTTAPAAREMGVSGQTVINLHKSGKLPAIRTAGGIRLFRYSDIMRLKAERAEAKRG